MYENTFWSNLEENEKLLFFDLITECWAKVLNILNKVRFTMRYKY